MTSDPTEPSAGEHARYARLRPPDGKSSGRLFRLQPALVTVVVGLVVLTAVAVAASAGVFALQQTRALIQRARTDTVSSASAEVRRFFEVAPAITDELVAQASRGALPLDNFDRLAALFAERLRR